VTYPIDLDGIRFDLDRGSGVATITLDVPEKHNRVSMLARDQLSALFAAAGTDDAVRVVMLAGAGDRAFTAGGDIPAFLEASPEKLTHLHQNVAAPERCAKPVIAKLHGYTFGVGLELALACDFRVAADDVQIGLPEVTIGMIPGSGGTQRMARLVGLGRAKDIVMRGRRVLADEALAIGLVTEVVPFSDLDAAADAIATELMGHSPLALGMAKRVLNLAYDGPLQLGLEVEGLAYGFLRTSDDFREGVEAFVEHRPPEYTGT
jgi:2-oxoglutaroyl-CoA hydrolase